MRRVIGTMSAGSTMSHVRHGRTTVWGFKARYLASESRPCAADKYESRRWNLDRRSFQFQTRPRDTFTN